MLRINKVTLAPTKTLLTLEGKLTENGLELLRREIEALLSCSGRVVLDLSGLRYLGTSGAKLLKEWPADKVELTNCSAVVVGILSEVI
jgi:anti-anti-sigma regulatory factor